MELIPEGYYQARAVQVTDDHGNEVWARWGKASTGTHQVLMVFEVIEEGDFQRTRVPWFGSFTTNSWERSIESLRYCGFQGDNIEALNEQTLDREVSIKVEHITNKAGDQTYASVAFVNAANPGPKFKQPMSRDEFRQFAAFMKSKLAGQNAAAGNPAPSRVTDPLAKLPI